MTFQRTVVGVLILLIAGLAGAFYIDWKLNVQLRTVKAFAEGYVFAEAVAACEKAPSTTPFKWNGGTNTPSLRVTRCSPTVCFATTTRSRRKPTSDRISWSGIDQRAIPGARGA